MSITFPTATKNSRAQSIVDSVDVGTSIPAGTINLLDSGDNILSKHLMTNPAFGAVTDGVSIANLINDALGVLAGAAVKFECLDRDQALVFSGVVGPIGSGADLESTSSSVTIAIGENVQISSLTYMETS